jgi:hypothetical protein
VDVEDVLEMALSLIILGIGAGVIIGSLLVAKTFTGMASHLMPLRQPLDSRLPRNAGVVVGLLLILIGLLSMATNWRT